jgi:hypothetical protein
LEVSLDNIEKAVEAFEIGEISYKHARKLLNNKEIMKVFIDQCEYRNIALYAKYLSMTQEKTTIKKQLMEYNGYITSEIKKNNDEYDIQYKKINDEYDIQYKKINDEYDIKIKNISDKHNSYIKNVINEFDIKFEKINNKYKDDIENIINKYDIQIKKIKDEYDMTSKNIISVYNDKIQYAKLCIDADIKYKSNEKYQLEQYFAKYKQELKVLIDQHYMAKSYEKHIIKAKLMYHHNQILDEIQKIKKNNMKIIDSKKKLKYIILSEQNKIINSKLNELKIINIDNEKKQLLDIDQQIKLKNDYKKLLNDCGYDTKLIIYKEYARLFDPSMIPKIIRDKRIKEFSDEVSNIFKKYTKYDFSIDYSNPKKMEFIIKSQLSGKNRDSDRLSGFERIILQIAINQACHPASRILFIDEKLDCMDSNNFIKVLSESINIIKKYYDTIIFISHRDVPTNIIDHQLKIISNIKYSTINYKK